MCTMIDEVFLASIYLAGHVIQVLHSPVRRVHVVADVDEIPRHRALQRRPSSYNHPTSGFCSVHSNNRRMSRGLKKKGNMSFH